MRSINGVCPSPHSFFSSDEEVDVLWRLQHLCRPLHTNNCSQSLGVILGIQHGARPRGLLSSAGGSQHITDLAVEVRVCWQFVEYQVPDAFDRVPVREEGCMKSRSYATNGFPGTQFYMSMASQALHVWVMVRAQETESYPRARQFIL